MKMLEAPDLHFLNAAEGWLELGNHLEANEELKRISLPARFHPLVLLARWEIYAKGGHWEFAHTIAHGLVVLAPDDPRGWINRSFSLHEMKRTYDAWQTLLPAADKFPKNPIIAYNLSCYACQLGRFSEAAEWLKKAIKHGDGKKIKAMAMADPDLKPLLKSTTAK